MLFGIVSMGFSHREEKRKGIIFLLVAFGLFATPIFGGLRIGAPNQSHVFITRSLSFCDCACCIHSRLLIHGCLTKMWATQRKIGRRQKCRRLLLVLWRWKQNLPIMSVAWPCFWPLGLLCGKYWRTMRWWSVHLVCSWRWTIDLAFHSPDQRWMWLIPGNRSRLMGCNSIPRGWVPPRRLFCGVLRRFGEVTIWPVRVVSPVVGWDSTRKKPEVRKNYTLSSVSQSMFVVCINK